MHIGILSARSPKYYPNRRLIEAASKWGQSVSLIHPKNCLSKVSPRELGLETPVQVEQLDVLLPRIGATINQYALSLVRHFELAGVPVVNGFQSILLARNKFLGLQALASSGIPVPSSYYVSNVKNFEKAVTKIGGYPVVAKTLNSRQGRGVVLVESSITAEFIISNLLNKRRGLLVQEFFAPTERKDIRVFVVGRQVVAAIELNPSGGDFRSNIHLKGHGGAITPNKEQQDLAIKSSAALGLEISGTDIIMDADGSMKVIEVNYSPGFRGLEAFTGVDIASYIIQYLHRTYGGVP